MHPMEMSSSQAPPAGRDSISRSSPHKQPTSDSSLANRLRSFALSAPHQQSTRSTPSTGRAYLTLDHTSPRRRRANTNDDRMTRSSEHRDQCKLYYISLYQYYCASIIYIAAHLLRNSSVPDSLNNLSSSSRFDPTPTTNSTPINKGLVYSVPSPSQSSTS